MVRVVLQRGAEDCGCAALAMLLAPLGVSYDQVAAVAPRGGQHGLRFHELVTTAQSFGVTLTTVRSYDLDRDAGVLRVRSHALHREGHWCALRYGLVWDPHDGSARPWREYAARFGMLARVG